MHLLPQPLPQVSSLEFPRVLHLFAVSAYDFSKLMEIVVRHAPEATSSSSSVRPPTSSSAGREASHGSSSDESVEGCLPGPLKAHFQVRFAERELLCRVQCARASVESTKRAASVAGRFLRGITGRFLRGIEIEIVMRRNIVWFARNIVLNLSFVLRHFQCWQASARWRSVACNVARASAQSTKRAAPPRRGGIEPSAGDVLEWKRGLA